MANNKSTIAGKKKTNVVVLETPVVNQYYSNKHRMMVILVGVIVLLVAAAYIFKGQFVMAWVNGKPITRMAYVKALEAQGGKQMLSQMITEQLINEAANQKKISIPPEDVTKEVASISDNLKSQGQDINQALAQQGMTMSDLVHQVTMRKLVTALTADQVKVTDAEVTKYISDNKSSLPVDKNTTPTQLNTMVRQQLEQTKQQSVITTYLSDLEKKANIQYWN